MDMDLNVAYLFRGSQPADAHSDPAASQRHKSTHGPAWINDCRNQVQDAKSTKAMASAFDKGPEAPRSCSLNSSDGYVAAYFATGRQSLRLSTASYSTVGESDVASFGEPPAKQEQRKLHRGEATDDRRQAPNAYGVRLAESTTCASGPPSATQTPHITPPSSLAHTDRGQDDIVQVAELQQKLEVSCEWAYELENDVAELSLEVEGLRELCAKLQHSLDRKDQDLQDAQLSNFKLRKRLASTEGMLAERLGVAGAVLPPSSSRSSEEQPGRAVPFPSATTRTSSMHMPYYALGSPPLSSASTSWTPQQAAGAYPTLTPLRTSLSCVSLPHAPAAHEAGLLLLSDGGRGSSQLHTSASAAALSLSQASTTRKQ